MIDPKRMPIKPKRYVITNHKGPKPRPVLAAVIPMPTFTGKEPCIGDPRFTADHNRVGPTDRFLEERTLMFLCRGCPVLIPCREWAIAHDKWNYAGGMSAQDREAERLNREQAYVEPHNAAIFGLDLDHTWTLPSQCPNGHPLSTNTALMRRMDNGRLIPSCTVCFDKVTTTMSARRRAEREAS